MGGGTLPPLLMILRWSFFNKPSFLLPPPFLTTSRVRSFRVPAYLRPRPVFPEMGPGGLIANVFQPVLQRCVGLSPPGNLFLPLFFMLFFSALKGKLFQSPLFGWVGWGGGVVGWFLVGGFWGFGGGGVGGVVVGFCGGGLGCGFWLLERFVSHTALFLTKRGSGDPRNPSSLSTPPFWARFFIL